MPTPREDPAVTLGSDCRIYVIGGWDQTIGKLDFATVEAYDPISDTWSTEISMPTGRGELAAATAQSGSIYAIGGFNGQELGIVERFSAVPIAVDIDIKPGSDPTPGPARKSTILSPWPFSVTQLLMPLPSTLTVYALVRQAPRRPKCTRRTGGQNVMWKIRTRTASWTWSSTSDSGTLASAAMIFQ